MTVSGQATEPRLDGPERARATPTDAPATSVFSRVRARAELVLGPIELHAHQLLSRDLQDHELIDAQSAAATLVRGLGELQLHGLAQLARHIEALLRRPSTDEALGVELAGAVEDIRTMLASAVAQLEESPALSGSVLAIGQATAVFDATLWVLSNHGHDVTHAENELPDLPQPPDVILANVGNSLDAAKHTTLRAIAETYRSPVVLFHDNLDLQDQLQLARHCSTLLPSTTPPAVVSEEIMRLRAAMTADLSATILGWSEALPVLGAHGYRLTDARSMSDLASAPYGAIVIGTKAGPKAMLDITRLIRVSAAARQAPVVWQGPLDKSLMLTASGLGVRIVDCFDDASAAALTAELRSGAADTDPASLQSDTVLGWAAARLLIDRALIAAQRGNSASAVAIVRLPTDDDPERRQQVSDLLVQEFRRGDVVGSRTDTDFVVALQGIGRRVALDRLGALSRRLGPDVRIGIAEFPGGGRSAEDLAHAAELAIVRAISANGPAVVSTAWRPAESRAADILVVDSDAVLGEMLAVALHDRGLRTRVEKDGHEALSFLTNSPDALPRVLMIDLDFGGADGRALLSALRPTGLLAHLNVLVMASRASENDIRMALDLGATDVIRKPFPIALMLHRIVRMLSE